QPAILDHGGEVELVLPHQLAFGGRPRLDVVKRAAADRRPRRHAETGAEPFPPRAVPLLEVAEELPSRVSLSARHQRLSAGAIEMAGDLLGYRLVGRRPIAI